MNTSKGANRRIAPLVWGPVVVLECVLARHWFLASGDAASRWLLAGAAALLAVLAAAWQIWAAPGNTVR